MSDNYIDNSEIPIYTDYSIGRIQKKILGLVPELDPALTFMLTTLGNDKNAVVAIKNNSQQSTASHHISASERKLKLSEGMDMLKRFHSHLKSHKAGTLDRRQYFPPSGTLESVNRKPSTVILSLKRIHDLLSAADCPVEQAAVWSARIKEAHDSLDAFTAQARHALDEKSDSSPELEEARAKWHRTYLNTKRLVEVVLRQAGEAIELERYFYDLRVVSNAKVHTPPVDEPDDVPLAEAGNSAEKPAP